MGVSKDAVPGSSFPGAFPPSLLPTEPCLLCSLLCLLSPTHGSSYSIGFCWFFVLIFSFFFFLPPHFILGGQDYRAHQYAKNKTKQVQLCRGSARHTVCHKTHPALQQQSWRQQLLQQTGSLTPGATEIPRSYAGDESKDDTLKCI